MVSEIIEKLIKKFRQPKAFHYYLLIYFVQYCYVDVIIYCILNTLLYSWGFLATTTTTKIAQTRHVNSLREQNQCHPIKTRVYEIVYSC
jgi:hypothetical protein